MEDHSKRHNKKSSQKTYQTYIDNHIIPKLGKLKVSEVKRADIAAMMKKMEHIPTCGNRTYSLLRVMFNLAEVWGYRESAVTALGQTDRTWRIVFESSSMAGCLSAARAGFAATVIADSQRGEGLRVLGGEDGLPELPAARFYAFAGKDSPASTALIEAARRAGQSRFTPRGLRDR